MMIAYPYVFFQVFCSFGLCVGFAVSAWFFQVFKDASHVLFLSFVCFVDILKLYDDMGIYQPLYFTYTTAAIVCCCFFVFCVVFVVLLPSPISNT